jgi:hypothetical protein
MPFPKPRLANFGKGMTTVGTMARFDADQMELWRACNQWMDRVLHPEGLTDPDYEFDQLTVALQLWAATHGLDGGLVLADAATAAYRREPIGDAVIRAQAFVELIKARSQHRTTPRGSASMHLVVSNCHIVGNTAQGGTAGSSAVGGDGLGGGIFVGPGSWSGANSGIVTGPISTMSGRSVRFILEA